MWLNFNKIIIVIKTKIYSWFAYTYVFLHVHEANPLYLDFYYFFLPVFNMYDINTNLKDYFQNSNEINFWDDWLVVGGGIVTLCQPPIPT